MNSHLFVAHRQEIANMKNEYKYPVNKIRILFSSYTGYLLRLGDYFKVLCLGITLSLVGCLDRFGTQYFSNRKIPHFNRERK